MTQAPPVLAMIPLNSATLPKQKPFIALLRERLQDASLGGDLKKQDSTLSFALGDDLVAISLLPAPIPWSDLEGPCATAWWWPEATDKLRDHTHHLIVALVGGSGTLLERNVLLTHVVAAVAASTDAAGIYWSQGTVVHEPATFLAYSENLSPAEIVPQLWIDMRLVENDDESFGFFTTGLAALGLLEIEIDRSERSPEEILEFGHDIVSYLATSGVTIHPGETFGRSEEEQIAIGHGESLFNRGKVMKLVF